MEVEGLLVSCVVLLLVLYGSLLGLVGVWVVFDLLVGVLVFEVFDFFDLWCGYELLLDWLEWVIELICVGYCCLLFE